MPAILEAIDFSATGPVLESVAAEWQAIIDFVASGSLFSFLQSAAMGGAAMELFTGIDVLSAVIAVSEVLVVKKRCRDFVGKTTTIVKNECQKVMTETGNL